MKLDGKVAIVTGGTSGIGHATCVEMAKEGAKVVVADINVEKAPEIVREIEELGGKAIAVKLDQSKFEDVERMMQATLEAFGELNICFANAGIGVFAPFLDMPKEEWDRHIQVNLNGTFYVCQAAARQMVKQQKGGKIIVTSSDGAFRVENQLSHYCTTKAALVHLVRCMASELGNYRINANAILPGLIETEMTGPMLSRERWKNAWTATTPLGRWGQPWEVAKLVVFLASGDADYINGQSIPICGGGSIHTTPKWFPLDYTETNQVDWKTPLKSYPYVRPSPQEGS